MSEPFELEVNNAALGTHVINHERATDRPPLTREDIDEDIDDDARNVRPVSDGHRTAWTTAGHAALELLQNPRRIDWRAS
ncbi:MAG: hypothetical protein AB7P03_22990 [Kofleriaceae bacterium]